LSVRGDAYDPTRRMRTAIGPPGCRANRLARYQGLDAIRPAAWTAAAAPHLSEHNEVGLAMMGTRRERSHNRRRTDQAKGPAPRLRRPQLGPRGPTAGLGEGPSTGRPHLFECDGCP